MSQREIIVEFECVQVIRKRTKTHLLACTPCGKTGDFVSLEQAAELFETAACDLLRFVKENSCHFRMCPSGSIHICLAILLEKMRERCSDVKLPPNPFKRLEK